MAYLTRGDILAVQDFKTAEVDVTAEWGGVVKVRELTAAQVQELGFGMYSGGEIDISKDRLLMTRVASWGIVDESHNPIFTEQDVDELGKKSYAARLSSASTSSATAK